MDKIKRNEFLKEIGFKGSALFALYCTGFSCLPEEVNPADLPNSITLDLNDNANEALLISGGYIIKNSIVIANNNGTYVAATQICSHDNKRQIVFRNNEWFCTDHGARFSISGKGLNKDASNGLAIYSVKQSGNILTIS